MSCWECDRHLGDRFNANLPLTLWSVDYHADPMRMYIGNAAIVFKDMCPWTDGLSLRSFRKQSGCTYPLAANVSDGYTIEGSFPSNAISFNSSNLQPHIQKYPLEYTNYNINIAIVAYSL
ncbi:hypothetical protein WA026_023497 [Henosepilachna vigintioctopunctata]|uniref:Uncharacterized protein n=1 Tax=Henosepilachna vigintioctopunctata TaxID=420089 RepID=A0AAW1V485_9CUCU